MSTSKSNATVPMIVSIRDSKGEVLQGATTSDTSVTVEGRSKSGTNVEVFDGTISKGNVLAGPTGQWLMELGGLALGGHSITARVDGSVSVPRTFSVVQQ
ncbi:hypothetical protein [Pseudomonas fluorescens]|uniref:hypothetical protein n=1 Tax=Pseudomonas fluorescens TaxID=294 RepID=UPI0009B7F7B6|nr:hypothetical protein [Pseudomonas fluorescens]